MGEAVLERGRLVRVSARLHEAKRAGRSSASRSIFAADVDGETFRALFDPGIDTVAAIVTYDDRTESLTRAGRYTLTVNGIAQPAANPRPAARSAPRAARRR